MAQELDKIIRIEEFDDFVLWKSIPVVWKGKSAEWLEEKVGLDDERTIKLCQYRYQKDFANSYSPPIHHDTITEWIKIIEREKLSYKIDRWALKLAPNVVSALYATAMATGKAPESELFLKVSGYYVPKQEVINKTGEHDDDSIEELQKQRTEKAARLKAVKSRMAAIAERGGHTGEGTAVDRTPDKGGERKKAARKPKKRGAQGS